MSKLSRAVCLVSMLMLAGTAAFAETQYNVTSWGLDRVDQRSGTDGTYSYDYGGNNVIIYVVDFGVADISELAIYDRRIYGTGRDGDHGTKVASIAAGRTYGVAKGAWIVDVNIAGASAGAWIQALNEIVTLHPAGMRGVVNMSLRWPSESFGDPAPFEEAITNLLMNNFTVVVAATEYGTAACGESPARMGADVNGGVITVSAVESDHSLAYDEPTRWYAGTGSCVDIFAPSGTMSANSLGEPEIFSHTSSATPFVTGAAALILEQFRFFSPNEVEDRIKENATPNVLLNIPAGTPNLLVYTRIPVVTTSPSTVPSRGTGTASTPSQPGATYVWSVTGGTIVGSNTGTDITFTVGCSGMATAKVTVTTAGGSASGFGYVDISPPTASVNGTTIIPAGSSAEIAVHLTGTGPWTVWWYDDVITTHTTYSGRRVVSPSVTTTYRAAAVRDEGSGCFGTTSGYATVYVY